MEEVFHMTNKEIDRHRILLEVQNKHLTQKEAGDLLNISDRQIRNLLKALKNQGITAIISKKRNKQSNRTLDSSLRDKALGLIRLKYTDFGPTLVQEKLLEDHNIHLSVETVRQWMIASHIWVPRERRKNMHLPRARRPCFGELIQTDGSQHRWFGEDQPEANLTVMIDDATGIITALYFTEQECLRGYFHALRIHLNQYGRPRGFYTDRHTIFKSPKLKGETHFSNALKLLEIELIYAYSPQAKGRVERVNRTLQDRLLKELHLRNIKTIEAGNAFLEEFRQKYNEKFSKKPMSLVDAHRSLEGFDLSRILAKSEKRTLNSSGIFSYKNTQYIVQAPRTIKQMKGVKIDVSMNEDFELQAFKGSEKLNITRFDAVEGIMTRKEVIQWKLKSIRHPPSDHPWKRGIRKKRNQPAMV